MIFAGCVQPEKSEAFGLQTRDGVSAEESATAHESTSISVMTPFEDNIPDGIHVSVRDCIISILCGIQNCPSAIEECVLQQYRGYTRAFHPDDLAPEEIACENVFSVWRDGRENPEIPELYEAAGEQWEYLYYVEYDFDGDGGEPDYIVLHRNADDSTEEMANICGGDIWYRKDTWHREELPETSYLIGGTWEKPELFMMLLTHIHGFSDRPGFAIYRNYETSKLLLYGHNYDRYERVKAHTIVEEAGGFWLKETGYQTLHGYGVMPVRLEITKEEDGRFFNQVIMVDRIRSPLIAGEANCTIWDGNDDGYEDILYYRGYDGGSGGSWDFYDLLCWSEEEQEFIKTKLPSCTSINFEEHKLYSRGQEGAFHEFYEIYGLQGGEYRLEKELELLYEVWADDKIVDLAIYSEYGVVIEETVITELDRYEAQAFLEEKYPEFNFWRQG